MSYDYRIAVLEDVKEYINDEIELTEWKGDREGLEEKLNKDLWIDDGVTGNGSGSHTFNAYEAEENLAHNLDLLEEALDDAGYDHGYLIDNGAEAADVMIRCYLLSDAISEALDDLESEGAFDEDEDEEEEEV